MALKKTGIVTADMFTELTQTLTNVGNLTVSGNDVTGFASGKYLRTEVPIDISKSYTYQVAFTTGTNITSGQAVMFTLSDVNVGIQFASSKLQVWGYNSHTWTDQFALTASTKYIVQVIRDAGSFTCKYKTTGDWITASTVKDTYTPPLNIGSPVMYGLARVNGDRPFLGTLHIDGCWIKQEGKLIFTGADAFNSTKTARLSEQDILVGNIIEF